MLTQILDHASQALLKLAPIFWGKPRFGSLLVSVIDEVQALEDMFWEMLTLRDINNADAERLEILGRIVGQKRFSTFSDEDYRAAIRARSLANRSDTTRPSQVAVLQALLDAITFQIAIIDGVETQITIEENSSPPINALRSVLPLVKGAGKRMTVVTGEDTLANMALWGSVGDSPTSSTTIADTADTTPKLWSVYDIGALNDRT